MNFRRFIIAVGILIFCLQPEVRAHEWHRHEDPLFAQWPQVKPPAVGAMPGETILLAQAFTGSRAKQSTPAAYAAPASADFSSPTNLGAAQLLAQTFVKFNPSVRFWWNTTNFYVESDGIPTTHNQMEGIWAWQRQLPLPMNYFGTNAWRLPLNPVVSTNPQAITTNSFLQGAIALAANGIPIFNPANNRGEVSAFIGELDYWGGHCGRADDYHYHAAPLHLTNTLGITLPIAFAMDGYPIYSLTEPDGSTPTGLDSFNGHSTPALGYHYHASTTMPFVNSGFRGNIEVQVSTNGQGQVVSQAGWQPRANGVRPSGTALGGAYIQTLTNVGPDQYQMFFSMPSNQPPTNYWLWTLNRAANTLSVTYSPYASGGGVTTTNYSNWRPAPAYTSTNQPLVVTQPTNASVAAGATAMFSATAAGLGALSYQWLRNGVELADGGNISGANAATLTISNAQSADMGAYSLVVTNTVGYSLSTNATLTVTAVRSTSQGRATTLVTNLYLAGQRVAGVGTVTASDGTVWTVPSATQFSTASKLPDLYNETVGLTPTNIAAVNLNSVPIVDIDPDGEVITGYIFGDNYFELYVNGVLVGVDPVPYTPFNSCVVKFRAKRPISYAVKLVDWEENLGLGTELNGGNPNHAGDGGFVASFSDGTVTGPNWKAQSFYIAPLDNPSLVVEQPNGTHDSSAASTTTTLGTNAYALHYAVPTNWFAKNFDDSGWPTATTYTEAQVGVNNQWAYLNFRPQITNGGAQFIWSSNLVLDNEVIVRFTGPAPTNTAPVFAAAPTNRYVINGGTTLSVTNTATDSDTPAQTLTYSLLTAPVGAVINTSNGVVTWATTTNNAGTSNYFRVVVTDSGTPAKSATNVFTVFVRSAKPNIVVIVTDDHGWGDVSSHGGLAQTPNMDRIGSEGVRLERFYVTPVCSVTRSTLLTGRSPNRTSTGNTRGLDLREHTLPVTFKSAGYQTFMCGKWHLGGLYNTETNTVINGVSYPVIRENVDYQPQNRGWDVHYGEYTGAIGYQTHISQENGQHDWWLNGQTNLDSGWSTDLLADKAIQLLQQRDPSKPALIYLAFNAVHGPVSAPTNYLNKYTAIASGNRRATLAALDQMDVAIGRVLDAIDAENITTSTLVTFFGDNGGQAASGGTNAPLRGDKGDLYDGGIHTPAAVRWPGVLPSGVTNCQQFMWVGDWFPTLCAAAGVTPLNTKPFDGTNVWPLLLGATNGPFNPANYRGGPFASGSTAGSGIFNVFTNTNGVPTMFKLIRDKLAGQGAGFTNYLFDIVNDPYESNDVVNVPAYAGIFASLSNYYNTLTTERYPPYIGAHPQSQSVTAGGDITLWAMSTIYAKPGSVQWRKNGVNIVGATNYSVVDTDVYVPVLNLTNVSAADAASYDVVVTDNATGWGTTTATSLVAVVTVTTPGSNTAPVLSAIANRTVNAGTTLLVSNVVTDAEAPPQTLAFTLPTAPSGANIDMNTGLITWTPTSGQANTTNAFTVVVTDNGTPPLSAAQSFSVVVLPDSTPFLTISGVAISPAAPTSNNTVWVTANISSSTNLAQAVLNYTTGSGGASATNVVFYETMNTNSTGTNGWDGTGAVYPWTVLSQTGAGSVKQTTGANHTPAGTGNPCGLEFNKGSSNASQLTMATTANAINATGTSGYVEFWVATQSITNGLGWTLLVSADNGTTFTTRLSETNVTAGHGFQSYRYDLLPSECVSTLKLRFMFFGNGVGGSTGPKVQIDDVKVSVVSAGAAYTAVAMSDDGAHGDGAVGDGVFGGQIPAFPTGTTVSYYLTATNNGGLTATNPTSAPTTLLSYTVTAPVITSTIAYDIMLGRPTDTSIAVSLLSSNDLAAYYEFGTSPGAYTGLTVTNSVTNNVPSVTTISGLQPNQRYYYRLRYATNGAPAFSAGAERTFMTKRTRGSTFSFVIEADPHNRDNVPDVWRLALTNMLQDSPDFLFDLGDTFMEEKVGITNSYYLTEPGIYDLHQEVRSGFFSLVGHSVPTFLVNGNHEAELGWLLRILQVTNNPGVWGARARQHYFPVPSPGGFYSGATAVDPYVQGPRDGYYAFEWGDALFVALDPYWYTYPKPQQDGWDWTLGTNQYFWLKQTLETSTAKFKFVFAHHLIGGGLGNQSRGGLTYHNFFEWGGSSTNGSYDFPTKRPGWPMPIKDLLLTNKVQVFFHGHDHLFVKEDYFAPGNTSSVPTFIYQEVPQPSQTIFSTNAAPGYAYTNAGSVVIPSSGHLRVTVSPTNALVEYLRVFRPVDENASRSNRMISYSYNIPIPVVSNGWSMARLPDTGQTSSYTTTPGEDSDYAVNPPSYTDNGNGTVTDNVTGLMWQKADGGEMTLSNALIYAQTTLNATNFAGYNDWRLPTIHELMSILNHDKVNPALNTNFFTSPGVSGNTWNNVYWWSSDQKIASTNQWCANSGGGVGPKPLNETISAGGTFNYRVRCMRGAPTPTVPRTHYVNNGNGTITDLDTGLMWQQLEVGAAMDWTNALNYCEGLSLGGFSDWRLPNIKELESLNDETRASPSTDTNFFPNAKSARYWSSTTQFGHVTNAWWNEFINGITSYEGTKTTNYWVRAVRGGLPNAAPVLTAIPNQTINAGYRLNITNVATDADSPSSNLTFNLPVSPLGAVLNSASGVLTWRPLITQASSTNPFTVVVADNGSPSLTATQSFSVIVRPVTMPTFSTSTMSNGQFRLLISGDIGPDYTVEASEDLVTWRAVNTNNPFTMPFFWVDTGASGVPMRFYRVILGP